MKCVAGKFNVSALNMFSDRCFIRNLDRRRYLSNLCFCSAAVIGVPWGGEVRVVSEWTGGLLDESKTTTRKSV